ncbi:leucyl-tRNA synthetase [Ruminiclostridium sufflavum DSM 19573]|uniref:Leucine--tRNA ligase n=1 Tax=Ruminiclostridium sufflavum DSM 19573 TaxID=1121337 RepID=A0A318XKG9_9FIRM|nr:leucine--tRNA ligase [Ruminiclostridium sufflavum]PYG85006.1 leucyl-tRNA synthetase [Ruminiclostridium sufflavum DSM 19573]
MPYSADIDRKWQKKWTDTEIYKFNPENIDKKLYCLEMFSYPSGANLHVGHWYNYSLTDSWARMKRMQGFEVFHPMGFDAFGLPAENYAIKTGIHPEDSTLKNIATMESQLKELGATFDWDYEIKTCMPDYYKWTQWLFLKLYNAGLAYRKNAPVNWCPKCNTVLANEQVINGTCERCESEVTKRDLTQWFFKITAYAQELIDKLETLDWPEKTKKIQTNWIGRSEGAEIEFSVADRDISFKVFTTRADTLYGVTYVVLAPENPIVEKITAAENREAVEAYIAETNKQSDIERLSTTKEKTGAFTGAYAVHPITGESVPIWIADYVLASYGTGCVMAVPAHDERDFDFATKYKLPIKRVIKSADGTDDTLPFCDYGVLVNSAEFDGVATNNAKLDIVKKLESDKKGSLKINYRLRDWLVSRQRYWGAPIPVVYCEHCGEVAVPEENLPVLLPYNVEFKPDGESPLKKCEEFMNAVCPKCGGPARRDPDTLDTFVCSSWYYLRYPDSKNSDKAFDTEWINKVLPVDKYVGGAEHAAMHLLYARFITKALRDLGFLSFDEPFLSLVHQGTILGSDGNKMSKSKGNTISPDEYVRKYGSDIFRMYLGFGFNYVDGGPWSDDGLKAISRFAGRIERLLESLSEQKSKTARTDMDKDDKELNYARHFAIKNVTQDTERFQFNTSISRCMELVNALYKYDAEAKVKNIKLFEDTIADLVKLVSPFAPHFAEEQWEQLGYEYSIFNHPWPVSDEKALARDTVEIAVQINGTIRGKIDISANAQNSEAEAAALADDKIQQFLEGKEIKKVIVVKGRLVNIVAK